MKIGALVIVGLGVTCCLVMTGQSLGEGGSSIVPESNQELLPVVLAGSTNTASSVKSGKGHISVHEWESATGAEAQETRGEYDVVFSGQKFKVKRRVTTSTVDQPVTYTHDGVKIEQLYEYGEIEGDVYDRQSSGAKHVLDDYNYRWGIGVPRTLGAGLCDLKEFHDAINFPGGTRTDPAIVGRETIDGDDCIVIEWVLTANFSDGSPDRVQTYRCWINTSKGFTLRKLCKWHQGDEWKEKTLTAQSEYSVRSCGDGLWCPVQYADTDFGADPKNPNMTVPIRRFTVTYAPDFQINVPVEDAELSLEFPSGCKVYDRIKDARYTQP